MPGPTTMRVRRGFLSSFLSLALVAALMLSLPREAGAFATTTPGPYGLSYAYTEGALFQFYFVNPLEVSQFNQNNLPSDTQFVNMPVESRFTWDLLFAPIDWSTGSLNIGKGYGFTVPGAIPGDLDFWLKALEWPTTFGYYNVTDAHHPDKQGSTAVRNIFYHNVYGTWFRAIPHSTNASPTDPLDMGDSGSGTSWVVKINDGRFDFTPLNYDNSLPEIGGNGQFIYFYSFTKEGAIGFLSRMYQVFSGDNRFLMPDGGCEQKKVAFTIDLSIPQVSCGAPGANGMSPFAVVINNLSPFDANGVNLKLYTYSDGDQEPVLVDDRTIPRISHASVAAGTPGSTTVTGFIPAPSKDFKLIAVVNVMYSPGGFTVNGVPGAWAANGFYQPTFNGQSPPGLGATVAEPYLHNNVNISGTTTGAPGGGGDGGGDEISANLVALNITCDPDNGNTVAKFRNAFPVNGRVNVRFYFQPEGDNMKLVDQRLGMAVQAGSEFTVTTTIPDAAAGKGTVTATVDLRLSGSSWVPEKYRGDDGKEYDETTYEDNKTSCAVAKKEYHQDTPEDHPAWYFPVKEEWVPKYEEYTEPVYGWKKVPFIKDPVTGKIRVLLVE
ncbi:hypothetical protein MTIN_20940 [Moorella thermoacetica]|nr:hypothetical protein MTIN_20940 [Moorella thermoacetica]